VLVFLGGSVVGVLLIPVAFGLWFTADLCTGLAEVFEYYAAANKARKAKLSAAKATAARMNRAA
jgi:hypothetical protein